MTSISTSKNHRQSGLELLRIIAMIMIVASHLSQRGNWLWTTADSALTANHFLMNIVICFGQVGVAIFFAITGYFLYNAKHYNCKRVFKILRPTWFYSFLFLVIAFIIKIPSVQFTFPLNSLMAHLIFPITTNAYWFISAYLVLFLLLPYIKIWLDNLNNKQLLYLIIIIAGIFIIPQFISYTIADASSLIFAIPAALFYTIVGYTLNRCKNKLFRFKNIHLLLVSLGGIVLYILSSVLIYIATIHFNYHNINNDILIDTMSLPCMLTSIPLIVFFSRQNFINRFINYVAGLTFGVYLIHSNGVFIDLFWKQHDILHTAIASNYGFLHFTIYFTITVILVFCFCAILEAIRKLLTTIIVNFKK